jgi:hypothetical protein
MTKFELLDRNKDFVQLLIRLGSISLTQKKHFEIYSFYLKIKEKESSKMQCYTEVSDRFGIQERQVINIISDFEQEA